MRGFRIELGEIEAVLASDQAVAHAPSSRARTAPGTNALSPTSSRPTRPRCPRHRSCAAASRRGCPPYMVPSAGLDPRRTATSPRTASSTANRYHPRPTGDPSPATYAVPDDDLERRLQKVWQDAWAVRRISPHDNFFDLGGHSLPSPPKSPPVSATPSTTNSLSANSRTPTIHTLATTIVDEPHHGKSSSNSRPVDVLDEIEQLY